VAEIDAAALTLRTRSRAQELLGASDEWAASLEELQYTLGEGPGVDAFRRGRPTLITDLVADGERWPTFAAEAADAGLRAAFAFPLRVGAIRFGTLDLYRRDPGGLTVAVLADAATLAEMVTGAVLDRVGASMRATAPDPLRSAVTYQDVNVATGMVAGQMAISLDDAFVRLRAHAFAGGRSVLEVARDVIARRLRLNREEM
jgi:hypothetical protein